MSRYSPRLRADKNMPIKYIKELELELMQFNKRQIIYETSNNDELTLNFYNNQLRHHISSSLKNELPVLEGRPPRIPIWDFKKNINLQDTLRLKISNKIKIDNLTIPLNILSKKLKSYINKATIIEYIYEDNVTYQDYINVLSAHKMAVWELRDTENFHEIDAMIRKNQFSIDESLNKERNRIRDKYPFHITERFE